MSVFWSAEHTHLFVIFPRCCQEGNYPAAVCFDHLSELANKLMSSSVSPLAMIAVRLHPCSVAQYRQIGAGQMYSVIKIEFK